MLTGMHEVIGEPICFRDNKYIPKARIVIRYHRLALTMNFKKSMLQVLFVMVFIFTILAINKICQMRESPSGIVDSGERRNHHYVGCSSVMCTDHSIGQDRSENVASLNITSSCSPSVTRPSTTQPNRLNLTIEMTVAGSGKLEMAGDSQTNTTRDRKIANQTNLPEELLKRLRPEIMKEVPLTFLPEYKNPCYIKQNRTLCLPYFFILGMPKCGTTDLFTKISHHPDIGSRLKEIQWVTRKSLRGEPLRKYAVHFYEMIRELVKSLKRRKDRAITVDASASTFWDNRGWLEIYPEYINKGPPYIVADVIKAILPDAKLIVMFRDPTSRLYSDFIFFKAARRDVSQEEFHLGVKSAISSYRECLTSRGSDYACAYINNKFIRLNIGLYSIFTRDWLRRYPREQFMFINLDDWHSNCQQILQEIFEFLDAEKLPEKKIASICHKSIVFENSKRKSKIGPMWNETKTILREFYRPYVIDLADVLQDDRFLWDYQR